MSISSITLFSTFDLFEPIFLNADFDAREFENKKYVVEKLEKIYRLTFKDIYKNLTPLISIKIDFLIVNVSLLTILSCKAFMKKDFWWMKK